MTLPSWSVNLPAPISVNAMFINRASKGMKGRMVSARYLAWRKEADAMLWTQKPLPRFPSTVALCIAVQEPSRRADLDNMLKGLIDYVVHCGIIKADDNSIVRMIVANWSKEIVGSKVTISEME